METEAQRRGRVDQDHTATQLARGRPSSQTQIMLFLPHRIVSYQAEHSPLDPTSLYRQLSTERHIVESMCPGKASDAQPPCLVG